MSDSLVITLVAAPWVAFACAIGVELMRDHLGRRAWRKARIARRLRL
jgi:hypothetical protein